MSDFHRDNEWQREQRDKLLAPGFYGKYAAEGRYVFIDKGRLADVLQRRFAVDTICQGKHGSAFAIEEKIVRWPGYRYASFCLETKSCTNPGHELPGWMFYGEADFLLYCFQMETGDLDCWLIDFPKLQRWFWPREPTFAEFRMSNTLNKTAGRKVPIMDVHRAVPCWRKHVAAPPPSLQPERTQAHANTDRRYGRENAFHRNSTGNDRFGSQDGRGSSTGGTTGSGSDG